MLILAKRSSKVKRIIKSIPFVGQLVTNIYHKIKFYWPGGDWQYDFRAICFNCVVRRLASLIGDKKYIVAVSGGGKVQVLLENGIKFGWIPRDPYSMLGMPLRGNFEPESTAIIYKLVKKGDIVIDVGGNLVGIHAILHI